MGDTCSACNIKSSTNTEITTDVHKVPSEKAISQKEEVNHE